MIDAADTAPAAQLAGGGAAMPVRSSSMPPDAAPPALPSDLWARIARAAMAAEGSTVPARVRLSLVSRDWRDTLRGARLCAVAAMPQLCAFSHLVPASPFGVLLCIPAIAVAAENASGAGRIGVT